MEIGESKGVNELSVVGNQRHRFAEVRYRGGEIFLLEVAVANHAVQSGDDKILHGREVCVRHAFGTIEVVESVDSVSGPVGWRFGVSDGERVAENNCGCERVVGRGVEELRGPMFEIGQRGPGATVPDQEFEGIEFEAGLRVGSKKLLESGDALGGVGLRGGGVKIHLLGTYLRGDPHLLTAADVGHGHYCEKEHAK